MTRHKNWDVMRSPRDGKWYPVTCMGRNATTGRVEYIPVGDGYSTRAGALKRVAHYQAAERAARAELMAWDGR
jgi:hypothetical protein